MVIVHCMNYLQFGQFVDVRAAAQYYVQILNSGNIVFINILACGLRLLTSLMNVNKCIFYFFESVRIISRTRKCILDKYLLLVT